MLLHTIYTNIYTMPYIHLALEWVQTLQRQIACCKEEELAASLTLAASSPHAKQAVLTPSLPMSDSTRQLLPLLRDLNVQELNRREKTVVYMYASEAKYLAYLRKALQVLVKPLDDLAKGVTPITGGGKTEGGREKEKEGGISVHACACVCRCICVFVSLCVCTFICVCIYVCLCVCGGYIDG